MAVRVLPSVGISPSAIAMHIVSSRNELRSALGANAQRIRRKGSHYLAKVQLPPLSYADSMAWLDLRTEGDECLLLLPFDEIFPPDAGAGAVRVNGSGQAGSSLVVDGFTVGAPLKKGRYFNHVDGAGRRRLYCCDSLQIAAGGGAMTIPLETMLTYPPADNDVIDVYGAGIQGFVTFSEDLWNVDVSQDVGLQFTIEERGS